MRLSQEWNNYQFIGSISSEDEHTEKQPWPSLRRGKRLGTIEHFNDFEYDYASKKSDDGGP